MRTPLRITWAAGAGSLSIMNDRPNSDRGPKLPPRNVRSHSEAVVLIDVVAQLKQESKVLSRSHGSL
jgi:hypothetical protein